MTFAIDAAAPQPPFEQLRAQVVAGALDGSLPAGTKLPTVRARLDVQSAGVKRKPAAKTVKQTSGKRTTRRSTKPRARK